MFLNNIQMSTELSNFISTWECVQFFPLNLLNMKKITVFVVNTQILRNWEY